MSETTRTANSVKVCLGILGEVKVDDNVDSLDVDTAGKEICGGSDRLVKRREGGETDREARTRADKISTDAVAEIVKDAVTM